MFDTTNLHVPVQPSGTITPLDPANLMTSVEGGSSVHPRRLTRRLLNVLGQQFPIGKDRDEAEFQRIHGDPLMSIASIAKRGWDLNEPEGRGKRARRHAALPTVDLPPEDATLLDRWTPLALQDITREQTLRYEHGVHGAKRDVARALDPVQRGMISEARVNELFGA